MFKASELSDRDIVNIIDGRRLGAVKDMHVDEAGVVRAVVLQGPKKLLGLWHGKDIVIPWSQVRKVGVDAVLVEWREAG
ncbi:MAG: YlmC/YmxH family sporulation protein [Thermoanaerobacterales bacterium]|nr:YlmC/YmxH family sporulation protein [Bacillota bacterium]MDI6907410.1 YlmC/YmxH family sporulation protein [Thermoanaerobacterales bacterium]